jgi:hypothetical protein
VLYRILDAVTCVTDNSIEPMWATHKIHRCARMCCEVEVLLLNIYCNYSNKTFREEFICLWSFFKHSSNDKFVTLEQWGIYGWKWPQKYSLEVKALSLKSQCTALKDRTIMNNEFGQMWKEAVMAYMKITSNSNKPEGCRFSSQWCQWNFSLTYRIFSNLSRTLFTVLEG